MPAEALARFPSTHTQPRKKTLARLPDFAPSRASPVKTSEISIDLVSEEDTVKFFLNI